ncbi:MAG: IS4 family transposase, partial [Chroococcidiopsidaceae cyanobacterium CP_BM_RX_35]|nr:IS4 family transposase [Chroococcidiopsidaceae cyanobacterium CP_BM_RX_35]
MVSLIWQRRAIPIYFELLTHKGSSSFELQTEVLALVLPLVKDYTVVLLGDREFCGVRLANCLAEQGCYFCLRLKQNEYIELEKGIWIQLKALGLRPGISLYLEGVRLTKQKGFKPYNLAAKWQKKYRGWAPDEGWFIFTNLESLDIAIQAYKKRFGIEEMFRDLKSGGYNLEGTNLSGQRLKAIILLITLAYTSATFGGKTIKHMGMQKYVGRVQEVSRTVKRHSSFYIGLYGQTWVHFQEGCEDAVTQLMQMTRNKWSNFSRGLRARTLILSALQLSL